MKSHKNRLAQFPLAVLADHVAVDNRCFQVQQGNDTELARLLECIEKNKATILDGRLPLLVDGYCKGMILEQSSISSEN